MNISYFPNLHYWLPLLENLGTVKRSCFKHCQRLFVDIIFSRKFHASDNQIQHLINLFFFMIVVAFFSSFYFWCKIQVLLYIQVKSASYTSIIIALKFTCCSSLSVSYQQNCFILRRVHTYLCTRVPTHLCNRV